MKGICQKCRKLQVLEIDGDLKICKNCIKKLKKDLDKLAKKKHKQYPITQKIPFKCDCHRHQPIKK